MQQRAMGSMFREHYMPSFLDDYHVRDVYIRSTDFPRTLMSAQAQLAGWFPPTTSPFPDGLLWQPLPVHTLPQVDDLLLIPGDDCSRFQELLAKHNTNPHMINILSSHAPLGVCQHILGSAVCRNSDILAVIGRWIPSTRAWSNVSIFTLRDVSRLADTLHCLSIHYRSRLNIFKQLGEAGYIHLQHLASAYRMAEYYGDEERRLTGGPLLHSILTGFLTDIAAQQPDQKLPRLQLFSGHDTTLAAFLTALDPRHFDIPWPPYASAIVVELRRRTFDGVMVVWIGFKNETHIRDSKFEKLVQPLIIPGCETVLCPIDQLMRITASVRLANVVEACQVHKPQVVDSRTWHDYCFLYMSILSGAMFVGGIHIGMILRRCNPNALGALSR